MPLVITENCCKRTRYVNGVCRDLHSFTRTKLFLSISNGKQLVPIFPVYKNGIFYYPITPGYAFTINKRQGQTLRHVLSLIHISEPTRPY